MSIATELTALAENRDAIKAAILSKRPKTLPGNGLSSFPAAISSIPRGGEGNEMEPYPWVGSGTHAWVHYDENSSSHVCMLNFSYYGNVTLDWGDGSSTVSLTGSSTSTTVTQSHEYANGDFRIDITGEAPLEFGHWDESSSSYKNTSSNGFISDGTPFNQANMRTVASYRDALVQFETDSPSVIGGGGEYYSQIGTTRNMRWIKFTNATELGNWPISYAFGLVGLYAPAAIRIFNWGIANNVCQFTGRILELPALQSVYDRNGNNPVAIFEVPVNLESFNVPFAVNKLPYNFMRGAFSLRSLRFLPNPDDPSSVRSTFDIDSNFLYRCTSIEELLLPEGITTLPGEACSFLYNVKKIELPSTFLSATNMYAFRTTNSLETLVCRATTPPTINSNGGFSSHAPNAKYYIPYGTTAAYTSATNWSQFSSLFVEMNQDGTIPTT